jgi:hypothetical protein
MEPAHPGSPARPTGDPHLGERIAAHTDHLALTARPTPCPWANRATLAAHKRGLRAERWAKDEANVAEVASFDVIDDAAMEQMAQLDWEGSLRRMFDDEPGGRRYWKQRPPQAVVRAPLRARRPLHRGGVARRPRCVRSCARSGSSTGDPDLPEPPPPAVDDLSKYQPQRPVISHGIGSCVHGHP